MNNTKCCTSLPELTREHSEKMSKVFQTLGDNGRLSLVLACMDSQKSVSELMEITGMSQSLTSHQLRALKDSRILRSEKQGRKVLYTIDDAHIHHIITDLAHHILENCEHDHSCK